MSRGQIPKCLTPRLAAVCLRCLVPTSHRILLSRQHNLTSSSKDVVEKLKPMFYGQIEDAKAFLVSIQGMKPTQITDKVNQLVSEKKISEMSKHRDLWKVLHDCGIYDKSESNWNQQVK